MDTDRSTWTAQDTIHTATQRLQWEVVEEYRGMTVFYLFQRPIIVLYYTTVALTWANTSFSKLNSCRENCIVQSVSISNWNPQTHFWFPSSSLITWYQDNGMIEGNVCRCLPVALCNPNGFSCGRIHGLWWGIEFVYYLQCSCLSSLGGIFVLPQNPVIHTVI
jgi:hypothetical protein